MKQKILFILLCILFSQIVLSDITVTEGDLVRLSVIANDTDDDILSFTFTEPINNKGLWQTESGDAGEYLINVTACDMEFCDSDIVKLIVLPKAFAPDITHYSPEELSLDIKEGESVLFKVGVEDMDSEKLYLSWELDKEELSSVLDFNYTPDYYSYGKHTVRFTVSDGELSEQIQWNIDVKDVNGPPVLKNINDITAIEGDLIHISPEAEDPDNDPIIYSISEPVGDDGLWQTGFGDQGEYDVYITASDSFLSDSQTVRITVENNDRPPVIVESYPEDKKLYVKEGEDISLRLRAEDPDEDDELSYVWTIDDQEIGNKKGIRYTINHDSAGIRTVKCSVSDGTVKVSNTWILVVEDVNRAPVLEVDDEYIFNESDLVRITPKAEDPDNDDILFLFSEPLDSNGEWQTDYKSSGVYTVNISVTDWKFTDSEFVKIVIKNIGMPPVFEKLGKIYSDEGKDISVKLDAYDTDGKEIIFSAENLPEGAYIEEDRFRWSIGYDAVKRKTGFFGRLLKTLRIYNLILKDSKEFSINIIAEAGDMFSLQTLNLVVFDRNRAPVLEAPEKISALENDLVKINYSYYDIDGDRIKTKISGPFDNNGEWLTDFDDSGEYNISISIDDNQNKTTKNVLVKIEDRNREPLLSIDNYIRIKAGEEIILEPRVLDLDHDDINISYSGWMETNKYLTGKDDLGIHTVTVYADDGIITTTKEVTIEVKPKSVLWFYLKFIILGMLILGIIIFYLSKREKREVVPEEKELYEIEEEQPKVKEVKKVAEKKIKEKDLLKTSKINYRHVIGIALIFLIVAASTTFTIFFFFWDSGNLVFSNIGDKEVDEEELLKIEFRTKNAEGINVFNLPYGSRFTHSLFRWTPSLEQAGIYNIKAVAYNNESEKSQNFTITVNDINTRPRILSTNPLSPLIVYTGKKVIFSIEAEDDDALKYTWYFGFEKYIGKEQITRIFTVPGKKTVKVKVSDGKDDVSYTWKVKVIDYAPKTETKTYIITEIKTDNVSFPEKDTKEGDMTTYIIYGGEEPDPVVRENDVTSYFVSG